MSAQHYHLQQEMTSNTGKLITDPMLSLVHTQKRKYRSIYCVSKMLNRALKGMKNTFTYKHLWISANYNTDAWVN